MHLRTIMGRLACRELNNLILMSQSCEQEWQASAGIYLHGSNTANLVGVCFTAISYVIIHFYNYCQGLHQCFLHYLLGWCHICRLLILFLLKVFFFENMVRCRDCSRRKCMPLHQAHLLRFKEVRGPLCDTSTSSTHTPPENPGAIPGEVIIRTSLFLSFNFRKCWPIQCVISWMHNSTLDIVE